MSTMLLKMKIKSKFLCKLSSFCSRSQFPLLIGGDFNINRNSEEKINLEELTNGAFFSMLSSISMIWLNWNWKTDCLLGLIIIASLLLKSWTDSWPAQIGTLLTIISVFMVWTDRFSTMFPFLLELIWLPLLAEISDMNYVGILDRNFTKSDK